MKRKCKRLVALFLALFTVLSGCASEYGFYADEISEAVSDVEITMPTVEDNGSIEEGIIDDPLEAIDLEDVDFSSLESLVIGVSDNEAPEKPDLEEQESDVTDLEEIDSEVLDSNESEESEVLEEVINHEETDFDESEAPDEFNDSEEINPEEQESEVAEETDDLQTELASYSLYVSAVGSETAVFTHDEEYFWLDYSEGSVVISDSTGSLEGNTYSADGYVYLGTYEEGTFFDVGYVPEDGSSAVYTVMDSSGEVVTEESVVGDYGMATLVLSSDVYVSFSFGETTQNGEDMSWLEPIISMDWRASASARGIYDYEDADDPYSGIGKVYWGETIEELIAMANDDSFDMNDDWDYFFADTIYAGTDYEGLLWLYQNGYTFEGLLEECCENYILNIWSLISGISLYAGEIGSWAIVKRTADSTNVYLPDIWFNWTYHTNFAFVLWK